MRKIIHNIKSEFDNRFGGDYILIKSPGRVNLIGEHTDYNDGFVLPAAVNKSILLAMSQNETGKGRFYAVDKDEAFETDITGDLQTSGKGWPDYLLGIVDQLHKHGYEVGGFDCVFSGNVPIGAGMSSSAALEGGVLFGLATLFDLTISTVEMAKIAQKSENEFVGVQCGIMDQFVSLNAKKDHVMKLDCRSLEYDFYPFMHENIRFVLCDSQVRRELVSSEYNVRRSQCEEGLQALRQNNPKIQSLRDVWLDMLRDHRDLLDPTVFTRCEYVIEENQRVLDACEDLANDDLTSFGRRMYASHEGLRDKYEVSCPELNILVESALKIDGVLGARMMGGGFGGCTINLVEHRHLTDFKKEISDHYREKTGKSAKIYQAKVSAGTHLIKTSEKSSIEEL